MVGGASLGLFSYPDAFFVLELAGTVLLFSGFLLCERFVEKERVSPVPSAIPAKGPEGA